MQMKCVLFRSHVNLDATRVGHFWRKNIEKNRKLGEKCQTQNIEVYTCNDRAN